MLLKTKVNFKKYLLISLLPLAICFILAQGRTEIFVIFIIYIGAVINQLLLVELVMEMVNRPKAPEFKKPRKRKLILLFVVKVTVLIAALSLGVHFMGNRVIIPLLNYVVQIFILGVSLINPKS